jgi:hypothetical protein
MRTGGEEGMRRRNLGEDGQQILKNFRVVAKSYADLFRAQRNHVHELLRGAHNYSSGVFRESLIRNFLTTVLPQSVSVDSGFVYGFEQVPTSKQIDILVWDSGRHASVYRTREFVIIPPEAVIAAISVKTALGSTDLIDSMQNLLSLTPLEQAYRTAEDPASGEEVFHPIMKMIVSYEGPPKVESALDTIGAFYQERFATDPILAAEMIAAFGDFNPFDPAPKHRHMVERIIPKVVAAIESSEVSLLQGWGPPDDLFGAERHGPGLRRLPYMYLQDNKLTTPLEKVVYYILASTYAVLKTTGSSLVSAWGEFNPTTGFRVGDASEVVENRGVRLLDPDRLAQPDDGKADPVSDDTP